MNTKDVTKTRGFIKYLKSAKRKATVRKINQDKVTHADIENYEYSQENK